jgi:ribulose-phosphate 3-epimerase
VRIYPSILSADFANLGGALGDIATADAAHVDVMDNHFVPNLTIGLPVVKRLQEITPIPLDVHLQIEHPDTQALRFAEVGVDSVTFHIEASREPLVLIKQLRKMGVKPVVSVKPGTSIEETYSLLDYVDMVLVMTVEPGFGGQKMMEEALPKIQELRSEIERRGLSVFVQVDGGVTVDNIGRLASLGADTFVAGSAVFDFGLPADNIASLRSAARTVGLES